MAKAPTPNRLETLSITVPAQAEALRIDRIRMAAYEIFKARSGNGNHRDVLIDWAQAEQQVFETVRLQ